MTLHAPPGDARGRRRAHWMALAQAGDRDAYRALLLDLGPDVMGYIRRRLVNRHEVDDVYQEVLLAIHVSRHSYEAGRPVEPWVFAIAAHVLARQVQRARQRTAREVLIDVPPAEPVTAAGPSRAEVLQALGLLPQLQRQALELLHVAGLSVEAAAARAGTTAGALRVRAHRAHKTLRALLFT